MLCHDFVVHCLIRVCFVFAFGGMFWTSRRIVLRCPPRPSKTWFTPHLGGVCLLLQRIYERTPPPPRRRCLDPTMTPTRTRTPNTKPRNLR